MFSMIRSSAVRLSRPTTLRLALRATSLRFSSTDNKITLESYVNKYSAGPIVVRYTNEHEWLAQHPDGNAFIGITKYASDALGDATYVDLPENGDSFEAGDSIGSVESVKSSSEIYIPVSAEIVEVNGKLNSAPQLINEDPLGEGWLARLDVAEKIEKNETLLTEEEYVKFLQEDH